VLSFHHCGLKAKDFAMLSGAVGSFAAVAALAALSLFLTVPTAVRRALRREGSAALAQESEAASKQRRGLEGRAAGLKDRALDSGDLLSRIAFLYRVSPARWPKSLNPEAGVLEAKDPGEIARGLARYLVALESGLAVLQEAESAAPTLPARTPSLLPVSGDLVEPSAFFGPRTSPWTGTEEFFTGLDLAAAAGSAVLAPAGGEVVFAGRVPPSPDSRLWRFGNLIVLSHGASGATLFGHLAEIKVRRRQRVTRGERIATVGSTGWAVSPGLHYEYWRIGGGLSPTDPRFAILDRRLTRGDVSLEKMWATSAPGPLEPLPGM